MIVGTSVCPGAPFLIEGTADAIAARLSAVVDACSAAVSRLPDADALLLITSGASRSTDDGLDGPAPNRPGPDRPAWRELAPGMIISTTPVRRSDHPDNPAVSLAPRGGVVGAAPVPSAAAATLSVGTMVGAALLAARLRGADVRTPGGSPVPRQPPTTAIEITGNPVAVAEMLADRVNSAERVAVLVIADGSACHGDDAPGRRDDRAAGFDAALARALAAGDPTALRAAAADGDLAGALLATVDPLTVLALLTARRPPTAAELLYSGAPLGVGYLVATWRWVAG